MASYNKKPDFYTSEQGLLALEALKQMAEDKIYNTQGTYSSNKILYPDNLMSFVDKHMLYLRNHLNIDPQQYISNLRLMTKIR